MKQLVFPPPPLPEDAVIVKEVACPTVEEGTEIVTLLPALKVLFYQLLAFPTAAVHPALYVAVISKFLTEFSPAAYPPEAGTITFFSPSVYCTELAAEFHVPDNYTDALRPIPSKVKLPYGLQSIVIFSLIMPGYGLLVADALQDADAVTLVD